MNIVRISDGLGNQMFQYAFARKLQIVSGRKVYLDTRFINHEDIFMQNEKDNFHQKCDYRKYGLNHFKIVLPEINKYVLLKWKFINRQNNIDKLIYIMSQNHLWPLWCNEEGEKNFSLMNCICPTYFSGYFFDRSYFDDIRNILRREFCVKAAVNISPELYRILKSENTISIHIRKGDFSKLSRDISQTDYYPEALKMTGKNIKNPVYIVFSDDIKWVKDNIEICDKKIYVSEMGFRDYEELTIMKHCKHHIIANSTFSYWAAYLNNNPDKMVVCPKRWKSNIIPEEWIRI